MDVCHDADGGWPLCLTWETTTLEQHENLMAVMEENNVRIKNEGERNFVEKKYVRGQQNRCAGRLDQVGFPEIIRDDIEVVPCWPSRETDYLR